MFFGLFALALQAFYLFIVLFGILLVVALIVSLTLCVIRLVRKRRGEVVSFSILLSVTGALAVGLVLLLCNCELLRQAFDMVLRVVEGQS